MGCLRGGPERQNDGNIYPMTHWYTADLHLGHEGILRFCNRPFASVGEMDAALIDNLWSCVQPDDVLWVVGDFAHGPKAKDIRWLERTFAKLPGAEKHLVVGNHDPEETQMLPWTSVSRLALVDDPSTDAAARRPLVLCHYPMMTWEGARKGALHLFGHVHDAWSGARGAVNVGVDQWDFHPVRIEDVARRAAKLAPHAHWGDVEHGAELA